MSVPKQKLSKPEPATMSTSSESIPVGVLARLCGCRSASWGRDIAYRARRYLYARHALGGFRQDDDHHAIKSLRYPGQHRKIQVVSIASEHTRNGKCDKRQTQAE